jgi:hypothetical protein
MLRLSKKKKIKKLKIILFKLPNFLLEYKNLKQQQPKSSFNFSYRFILLEF